MDSENNVVEEEKSSNLKLFLMIFLFMVVVGGTIFFIVKGGQEAFAPENETESTDELDNTSEEADDESVLLGVEALYGVWQINSVLYPKTENKTTSQHQKQVLLELNVDGSYRTTGGCNSCSGNFEVNNEGIIVFTSICSKLDCKSNEVEFDYLQESNTYTVTEDQLSINLGEGSDFGFFKFDKCVEGCDF